MAIRGMHCDFHRTAVEIPVNCLVADRGEEILRMQAGNHPWALSHQQAHVLFFPWSLQML